MSAFNAIGESIGRSKLGIAKALGVQMNFSHRGAAAQTLWVRILKTYTTVDESGGSQTEVRVIVVEIPVQDGFARATSEAEPLSPGDTLSWIGRTWFCTDRIDKQPAGYFYTAHFAERKRLASGV
jgi:hypothetical protein